MISLPLWTWLPSEISFGKVRKAIQPRIRRIARIGWRNEIGSCNSFNSWFNRLSQYSSLHLVGKVAARARFVESLLANFSALCAHEPERGLQVALTLRASDVFRHADALVSADLEPA